MPQKSIFPYYFAGRVVSGFGRGGKQLGCPTANMDESCVEQLPSSFPCGVFYGLAQVDSGKLYGMVMSIGWNPHFKNEKKTIEVHILHSFEQDFYGAELRAVALGYLRPMQSYGSLDDLRKAIANDISSATMKLSEVNIEDYVKMEHFRSVTLIPKF